MTDHKFTDDDVIKALECCTIGDCFPCAYGNIGVGCRDKMNADALALINRQKAEIEAKEEEYADLLGQRNAVEMMLDRANYNCDKADEEIEYLKSENARLITSNSQLEARVCEDRAEIESLKKVLYELKMEAEMVYKQRDAQKNRADSIAKFARAEAIKEFAERLKANMSNIARMEYGGHIYFCVGYDLIDTLVKEMTEDENEKI
jgi:predicted RNase H-like nuclease (RuvC/YqgF family)